MPVSHVFSCTIADDAGAAAAGEVLPSHWNSVHSVSLATNEVIKWASAGTQSVSSGTLVFANSNGLSFGMDAGTVTASHNGLTTAALSNHSHGDPTLALTNLSGTTASNSAGLTLSLSAGAGGGIAAAAGTQTATSGTIVFANSNGVTFGMSNSSQITASVSQPQTVSYYQNIDGGVLNAQSLLPTQSTFAVFPFSLGDAVSCSVLQFLLSPTIASTTFASTANTTFSYNQVATLRWLMYTRNAGASSMSLASVSSGSQSLNYSLNFAFGSASNTTHSMSYGFTGWDSAGNSISYSTSDTTSGSQVVVRTANVSRLTGWKYGDLPFVGSLSPGPYWIAFNFSTTATSQGTNLSGARLVHNVVAVTQINSAVGDMASANANTQGVMLGIGSFTTAGGESTASMGFSNITTSASHPLPYIRMGIGLR
jgi:hypothetical protein